MEVTTQDTLCQLLQRIIHQFYVHAPADDPRRQYCALTVSVLATTKEPVAL